MISTQRLPLQVWLGSALSASMLGLGLGIGLSLKYHHLFWQPFLIPAFVAVVVLLIRLRVQIDAPGISLRFTPFYKRFYPWSQIVVAELVSVDPLGDFGGWGLKYSSRFKSWGYLIRGEDALRISLADGKQIYATITDPEAAQQAIHRFQPLLA